MNRQLPAPVQARDSIIIEAPPAAVWPLIADSRALMKWGPPVQYVEVIDEPEGVGSRRRIHAKMGKRTGQFLERRLVHDENQRMAFQIVEETFGLFRFLEGVGSIMEIEPAGPGQTRLVWSFFHRPHSILGRILHRPVILRQQRSNRLRALASLKAYAEHGTERPEP
jgi:uncharacterized protein YndB with AHSA1/START domain